MYRLQVHGDAMWLRDPLEGVGELLADAVLDRFKRLRGRVLVGVHC
ncbi:hypothetical protein QA802_06610 [Streptomyces sp. B21-105]|nr:hypothetical protein OH837_39580 [Streptomyces canus]